MSNAKANASGAPAARKPDADRWAQPQDTNGLDMAFGGDMRTLLPPMAEIPAEFKQHHGTKWNQFQADWFFFGLKNKKATPKPGIDSAKAFRHLAAIQGSWDLKHEHKAAAVAWLASRWFEDITYEKADQ